MRWILVLLCLSLSAVAQTGEKEDNPPVAIVAQSVGNVTYQRSLSQPGQRLYALQLLYPQDRLVTGPASKAVILFFFDRHYEAVDGDTAAQLSFQSLVQSSREGSVRRLELGKPAPAPAEVQVPGLLLSAPDLGRASPDPESLKKEEVYLGGRVECELYPPVFHCQDLKLSSYRYQLFDEKGAFLLELPGKQPKLKYPNKAFRLTKGALYYFQVLGPDGSILVWKYPFRELTRVQAKLLAQVPDGPLDQVKRFLLYDELGLVDRNLSLLRTMLARDGDNPNLRRALAQLYLVRGCPAHARQVMGK